MTAIFRTRAYYKVPDLVGLFKIRIRGLTQAHNGGYFHATSFLRDKTEHAQNRFLRELETSPEQAFLDFNFAPPQIRLNIAYLGLLHKRAFKFHSSFQRLLPWYAERFPEPRSMSCHTKQLYGHHVEISHQRSLYDRSIFAMVDIYDNLSQTIVESPTVSSFQTCLNKIAKSRCESGAVAWIFSFSRQWELNFDPYEIGTDWVFLAATWQSCSVVTDKMHTALRRGEKTRCTETHR